MIRKRALDRVEYKCWRAGCGLKGVVDNVGSFVAPSPWEETANTTSIETYHRTFNKPTKPVGIDGYDYFREKFDMDADDLREGEVTYSVTDNRYVFPVYSPQWVLRGRTCRTFDPRVQPKWDSYPVTGNPTWLGWYIRPYVTHNGGPVVVVEDPISSLKASRVFMSCFLNGTDLSIDKVAEILKVGERNGVVFALDADATAKAIQMLDQWKFFLGGKANCVPLSQDIKYMSTKEIHDLVLENR